MISVLKSLIMVLYPVITEIITNDLKYGNGKSDWKFSASDNMGKTLYHAVRAPQGRGSSHIRVRIEEAGGQFSFHLNDEEYRLNIDMPAAS